MLITHGPPFGIADATPSGEHVGCEELRKALARVKPKIHIFGHIHGGYGTYLEEIPGLTFINASNCDESYRPFNKPIVFEKIEDR